MTQQKHFKKTAIALALSAWFPMSSALAEDITEYTSPDNRSVTLDLYSVSDVNPLYREYHGTNHSGLNADVDVDVTTRSEDGTWVKVNAENLGQNTQEAGISYEKQGQWAVGIQYNQIPHYAPYEVSTAVIGAGTTSVTQPTLVNADTTNHLGDPAPALSNLTLKTQRDITSLTASKTLAEGLQASLSFTHEKKEGLRMYGVRGTSSTTTYLYQAFDFTPEPIDQSHNQIEAKLSYATSKYQLAAGYYGSFFNNANRALYVEGGGTGTALYNATLGPISLPPDNSAQQIYLDGAISLTKDTRASLKMSYTKGKQDDTYINPLTGTATGAPNSLDAKVEKKTIYGSVFSRLTKDVSLLAKWRYEDKNDNTPIFLYYTNYPNNPSDGKRNDGTLELSYAMPKGYGLTAGVDYNDTHNTEWELDKTKETTVRINLRKAMSETVNGNVLLSHAHRTGQGWPVDHADDEIVPTFLTDRNRDKLRGMVDWSPNEKLNLQVAYEGYFDDYKRHEYGLDSGKGQVLSLDGSYVINDIWKMNAWVSTQWGTSKQYGQGAVCTESAGVTTCASGTTTFRTGELIQWDADLDSRSNQFGIGLTGKIKMVDVGANLLFAEDKNTQKYNDFPATTCLTAGCATTGTVSSLIGILPDTKYRQTSLNLFGVYPLNKTSKIRVDYTFDRRKMNDYTWEHWVYADGTQVFVDPKQTTHIVAVSFSHKF